MRSWFALFRFFSRGSLCWISPSHTQIVQYGHLPLLKGINDHFSIKAWILLMKAIVILVQIYRNDIYLHFSTYSLQLYSCYYILYLSACIELLLTWSSIHCHLISVISIPVSLSFSFSRRIDWFADLCSAFSREDKQQQQQQQQINN